MITKLFFLLTGASNRHYSKCIELPPLGIFSMNLLSEEIELNPWQTLSDSHLEQLLEIEDIFKKEIKVKTSIDSPWLVKELHESRCYNFETILKEYIQNPPTEIFQRLLGNENIVSVCDEVLLRLEKSLSDRISATPSLCRECLRLAENKCDHAKIGILFSGGIDCTILAILTDKLLDASQPIDLINVSFEKINRSTAKAPIDYNTPDRISAKESLDELKQINPNR